MKKTSKIHKKNNTKNNTKKNIPKKKATKKRGGEDIVLNHQIQIIDQFAEATKNYNLAIKALNHARMIMEEIKKQRQNAETPLPSVLTEQNDSPNVLDPTSALPQNPSAPTSALPQNPSTPKSSSNSELSSQKVGEQKKIKMLLFSRNDNKNNKLKKPGKFMILKTDGEIYKNVSMNENFEPVVTTHVKPTSLYRKVEKDMMDTDDMLYSMKNGPAKRNPAVVQDILMSDDTAKHELMDNENRLNEMKKNM